MDHKKEAVEDFFSWLGENLGEGIEAHARNKGKIPYGAFAEYARNHEELRRRCTFKTSGHMNKTDRGYMRLLKMYGAAIKMYTANGPSVPAIEAAGAVAECSETAVAVCRNTAVAVCSDDPRKKHIFKRPHKKQYTSTKRGVVQDWKRRRLPGAGRNRLATYVRDGLFQWYEVVRHSVNVKIMCRFPKLAFKVKARMLYEDYLVECVNRNIKPETVRINDRWVNDWLIEHRLTQRMPNRKWKVSRPTLKERPLIYWTMIHKLRKFIVLAKGYDPDMRNLDQSPFHMNEAGSHVTGTIAMKGAPVIPLLENHGHTRERWSLNSVTDSSEERINSGQLPGFEAVFKATGGIKAKRLQQHVDALGSTFKVSVVTGPSGSYREEDILRFLDKWCEQWGPNRKWEFMLLDAYAPGLTNNVQRLCWKRGYIVVTHGGGASMICQTNDTALHSIQPRCYIRTASKGAEWQIAHQKRT